MTEETRTTATRRFAPLLVAAGVAAALALFFGRACLPGNWIVDRTPGSDSYFLATIYERWAAQVGEGHLPLWFSEFGAGFPVHAAWMYGLAYPPLAAFLVLPPETAWVGLAILHAAFGAAGMFLFLRDEEHRDAAAAAGAVVFALSGFVVGRVSGGHLNLVMPMAWTPWVLLAAGRCVRGGRRDAAILGLVAGAGLLAGHVQVWFYAGPLTAAFAFAETRRVRDRRAALTRLLVAGLIACGISSIQWMPALELVREGGALDAEARTLAFGSAGLADLAAQAWPSLVTSREPPSPTDAAALMRHEYLGLAGPLAVLAVLAAPFCPRRGRWFWLGAAAVGLLLAAGTTNAASRVLGEVPPFSLGRVPARALVIVVLAAAPLAANAVSVRWRGAAWIAPVAFGVSALASMPRAESVPADFYYCDVRDAFGAAAQGHRVHVADARWPLVERFGVRTLRDVCPVTPRGYRALIPLSAEPTAWWFDVAAEISADWRAGPPRNPAELERLVGTADVKTHPTLGRAAVLLPAGAPSGTPSVFAALDRGERLVAVEDAVTGATTWMQPAPQRVRVSERPGAFEIDASPEAGRWLFLSETAYPGWEYRTAEADWTPAHTANLAFLAVPLGGDGRVRLRYAPAWLVPSAALAASSLVAAALLLLRRRSATSAATGTPRSDYPPRPKPHEPEST